MGRNPQESVPDGRSSMSKESKLELSHFLKERFNLKVLEKCRAMLLTVECYIPGMDGCMGHRKFIVLEINFAQAKFFHVILTKNLKLKVLLGHNKNKCIMEYNVTFI